MKIRQALAGLVAAGMLVLGTASVASASPRHHLSPETIKILSITEGGGTGPSGPPASFPVTFTSPTNILVAHNKIVGNLDATITITSATATSETGTAVGVFKFFGEGSITVHAVITTTGGSFASLTGTGAFWGAQALPGGNFFNLDGEGIGSINTIKFTLPGAVPTRYLDSLQEPAPKVPGAFSFLGYQTIAGQPSPTSIKFEDNVMSRDDLKVIGTLDVTCTYADSTLTPPATCSFTLTITGKPLITGHVVVPADGGPVTGTFTTAAGRHGTVVSNTIDQTSSAHPNFEGLTLVATLHFGGRSH
jgi:hypothetical protein